MIFLNCQLVLMSFNFNEHFLFRCWVSVNIILFLNYFFSIPTAQIHKWEHVSFHQTSQCCEEEVTPPTKGYVIDLQSNCNECLKQNTPTDHISFSPQCRMPGPVVPSSLYLFSQTGAVSIMHILMSQWLAPAFRCIPSNNYSWPKAIASIIFSANIFWK